MSIRQTTITFLVTDTGEEETLKSFRKKHAPELTYIQIYHRYVRLGRPKSASITEMTAELQHGGQNERIIQVGKEMLSMADIMGMCNAANNTDHSRQFYFSRWIAIGKPEKVKSLKWFLMSPDKFKKTRQERRQGKGEQDLDHIPCGDLAHLSGTKNTGKGKGEIHDEEWIGRIGSRKGGPCTCFFHNPLRR